MRLPMTDLELNHWPLDELRELHLEMGKQCNVRCSMCYQTDFSPASKLPEVVWKDRLAEVYSTARRLTLSGGEPTVLSNCRELVELVIRKYPHLGLVTVTNGLLFKGIWEEAFLQQGEFLNFSLNAVTPELYRKIVQFGRQEDVIRNIDRMVKRKREVGSPLVLRTSAVIFDQTVDELPRFVQWNVDHGLDQVLFFTDHFGTIHAEPSRVQARLSEAYEIADRNPQLKMLVLEDFDWSFAAKHKIPPVRPRPVFSTEAKPCPVAFDTLFVNPDGSAKPCCKSWYLFGNLVRSPLEEIWNSPNAIRFRKRMMNLDFRDCLVVCDLNPRPISRRMADARKAYWIVRRDPAAAVGKALRKLGVTTSQSKSKFD